MDTEQEVAQLRDYIIFLETENATLAIECAQLKDELEKVNEPKYN